MIQCIRSLLRWPAPHVVAPFVFIILMSASYCLAVTAQADGGATVFASQDHSVRITSDFPGGRMNGCVQVGPDEFMITICPESAPINDSAWYAFRIESDAPRTLSVHLNYEGGTHRYTPKISFDGEAWHSGEHLTKHRHPLGTQVRLEIPVRDKSVWIAGQELLSTDQVSRWATQLSKQPHVTRTVVGQSVEGRPIERLDITDCDQPKYVFIVARQHPPEVSGAIGMMHFVDAIAADSPLAREFRDHFDAVVVPTANPDGVAHGNWRCNVNGVDLNRDWLHFTQPETQVLGKQLRQCRNDTQGELCLFIDFHSTYEDVFYLPSRELELYPAGFTDRWLSAIQDRFPRYQVSQDDTHNTHRSTSKAWVSETLGVSAVTYEFGDDTNRDTIRRIASGAAEEMMRLMLELH